MELYGLISGKKGIGGPSGFLLRALNGRLPSTALDVFLTGALSGKASSPLILGFLTGLRYLVNFWIDSGRNGSEDRPWERTIPVDLLREYMARHPPILDSAGPAGPLYLLTGPPNIGQSNMYIAAQDAATCLFLQLLDSPTRSRLSRCDDCGTYFVRARTPKRDAPIYHGVFCEKHKGKGGTRRTLASRKNRTEQMVEMAADFWSKWKPSPSHGKQSEWIAMKLNKSRLARTPITGKWVTQHRIEIEAEVQRRNHAKGKD